MMRRLFIPVVLIFAMVCGCKPRQPPPAPPAPPPSKPAEPKLSIIDTVVLEPDTREVPGEFATTLIRYHNPAVSNVTASGSWDQWRTEVRLRPDPPLPTRPKGIDLRRGQGYWTLDTAPLKLPQGRYEFKFLADGQWEEDPNRVFYVDRAGEILRPVDLILTARMEERDRIDIYFKEPIKKRPQVEARLIPDVPIISVAWRETDDARQLFGFAVAGDEVTFCLDEAVYGIELDEEDTVAVAGTFNEWAASGEQAWLLERQAGQNLWQGTHRIDGLANRGDDDEKIRFAFVVNGGRWLAPPILAPNAEADEHGHVYLTLSPSASAAPVLTIRTRDPLAVDAAYQVAVHNINVRDTYGPVTLGRALDAFQSARPLGMYIDRSRDRTGFRIFAPRATKVDLCFYARLDRFRVGTTRGYRPEETIPLTRNPDTGTWEGWANGIRYGQWYGYRVDGPEGDGNRFEPEWPVNDPYGLAVAHEDSHTLALDPAAKTEWFDGWTDQGWQTPALGDAVIYETHVRDFSRYADRVRQEYRGKFEGFLDTRGTGIGLDHLKMLGVNTIQLMPVQEYQNKGDDYGVGYSPVSFFAPESSYGQDPERGSQVYELKRLVNELHQEGFAVILDVVYTYVGETNLFATIDNKYYFRLDHAYGYSNFSGKGNDLRTGAPMVRRMIVESVLHWMREYHVDGFHFTQAELMDRETRMEIRDKARELNPNVILISDPRSARGDHIRTLRGTGWSARNGGYRDTIRAFVAGKGDRDHLKLMLTGSGKYFAATPSQSINYLESHQGRTLADALTANAKYDGRSVLAQDAARNRMAATLLFTSLGVPMLGQGQDWMRSKHGFVKTGDKGDEVNALDWTQRGDPNRRPTVLYYRELIQLRRSEPGKVFLWDREVPPNYYRWIEPRDEQALGYLVNSLSEHPGGRFAVLVNASSRTVEFDVPLPEGHWRMIGNGNEIRREGILVEGKTQDLMGGRTYKIKTPPLRTLIFAIVD